ncbi:MAG: TonB C-terminal domain-containing protein [bacterium]|nr:TonB C-terminal domain-containing protein [bacterium]
MYDSAQSLFDDERFRRLFLWSAAGHVLLAFGLWFAPNPSVLLNPPTPVYIDVVTAAPRAAPPPRPAAARPAPPKQVVDEIVIPKLPKEPKPAPKAKPKPKPKPVAKTAAKKPAAVAPPSPEDLLESLRKKVDERQPKPGTGTASPNSRRGIFDPEKAGYQKKLTALFYQQWVGAACKMHPKPSHFEIRVAPDGSVKSVTRTASSGNRFCDESAERAIRRVDQLPTPPARVGIVTVSFDILEIR